jgi:hypothetical protein
VREEASSGCTPATRRISPYSGFFFLVALVVETRARHREYGSSYRARSNYILSSNIRLLSPK